ncbi:MAG TPA: hypothetical protein VHQ65_17115 [Thermoanaerobaculia bacterium]|nr:hypothetical protein [Thermoanaerobaculia bacterium]
MSRVLVVSLLSAGLLLAAPAAAEDPRCNPADPLAATHVYLSNGVHNDCGCDPPAQCDFSGEPGRPPDPLYPEHWTAEWTLYQVFEHYQVFPPPYTNPPENLTQSDYRVSRGSSYYDASYVPTDGDGIGAMMEFYGYDQCLPIFPLRNDYTCAFVSLGNKAYFLNYGKVAVGPAENGARPPQGAKPSCCRFSDFNHPPRRDFIKHVPYSPEDSTHLGGTIQAYAYEPAPGLLFAYAFYKDRTVTDPRTGETFQLPQSFYFSGQPTDPPDAPIVSQNYESFRIEKPGAEIWAIAREACTPEPEWCCLFATDCPGANPQADAQGLGTEAVNTNWSNLSPPVRPEVD